MPLAKLKLNLFDIVEPKITQCKNETSNFHCSPSVLMNPFLLYNTFECQEHLNVKVFIQWRSLWRPIEKQRKNISFSIHKECARVCVCVCEYVYSIDTCILWHNYNFNVNTYIYIRCIYSAKKDTEQWAKCWRFFNIAIKTHGLFSTQRKIVLPFYFIPCRILIII